MVFLALRIENWDLMYAIKLLMGAYFATSAMRAACVFAVSVQLYQKYMRASLERER